MAKNTMTRTENKIVIQKILKYISRYIWMLVLSIILAFTSAVLALYLPVLVGKCIDKIVDIELIRSLTDMPTLSSEKVSQFGSELMQLLIRFGIIVLISAVCQWLMNVCNNHMTYGIVRDIRHDAFEKIQKLPLSYLDVHSHGDIVSRVIADVDTFADGLLMGFTQFFTGIVTIVGTLVFMITVNIPITIMVVVLTPLSLFVASFIASKTHNLFVAQSETKGRQTSLIDEMVGGVKVVKAFGREDEVIEEFNELNEELRKVSLKSVFYSSLTNPCTRFINNIIYAAVALFGGYLVISGRGAGAALTVGGLTCLLSYANQYTKPFNEISGVVTELQNALACAGRIFEIIEEEAEVPDKNPAKALGSVEGNVEIKDVDFSYVKDKPLIEDFNLSVKKGMRVAIVGPTGCGKTTFINLLMRFYDIDDGVITVDGENIQDVTRHSLRENFGMVLQETWLSHGTIRDNICMGKEDATDEEIVAAAKACHADSFIRRLPNGYDTYIGDDLGGLSEGQKQLLCIARVMLLLPPMLILDEATSSIDTRTEMKIQSAFARMMEGRTSFVVAHRLSTIRTADIILVMKDGKIIESGSHSELMSKQGFYSNLYNSQFKRG